MCTEEKYLNLTYSILLINVEISNSVFLNRFLLLFNVIE